MQKCTESTKKK